MRVDLSTIFIFTVDAGRRPRHLTLESRMDIVDRWISIAGFRHLSSELQVYDSLASSRERDCEKKKKKKFIFG